MAFVTLFFANDDQAVSEAPSEVNPVEFTLRRDLSESDSVRLYAQADTDFEVTEAEVQPVGATAARWELAPDASGSEGTYEAPGALLSLGTVGDDVGTRVYFWARASAEPGDTIENDNSVTLDVGGIAASTL